ncbi:MAG TPA: thioredoxin domain-containing protein [Candidatus Udaeobacter sp.]|nr:thioredoxin domain-containing protein [Candidatus Udaeobacter sp.]
MKLVAPIFIAGLAVLALKTTTVGGGEEKYTNRLIHEKSPYLLQHAHNPVDWYPWGKEAFDKAKKENKPLFLSVGYSTCHWCHVMEHESFENPAIAKLMNENFVNIKVDREQRPDIDQVYMTFVQATTGSGGWPMTVFLTPDLKPFFGGTYFPPEDKWGQPGLTRVLKMVADAWKTERENIVASSDKIISQLQSAIKVTGSDEKVSDSVARKAYEQFASQFDAKFGGFGSAPKFPRPVTFNFLYDVYGTAPDSKEGKHALEMSIFTLRKMAEGGIHDHIGGGFHRYSTDKYWHVPHFEKMLYDQAQLAIAYLTAFQITREPLFEKTARDILDYVRHDITDKEGGFYSAEDADSLVAQGKPEHAEGAFYVWSKDKIDKLLGEERAKVFDYHFGVEPKGNALEDPEGEFKNKNILIQRHDFAGTAKKFGLTKEKTEQLLAESQTLLFEARAKRPRPPLDDKIVTAWNGLMISAFARAAQMLDDPAYLEAANKAADFVRQKLYRVETNTLLRSYRQGASDVNGFASDYAFLVQGLIDLYEASFDVRRIEWAMKLQQRQDELFQDAKEGGYFVTSGADGNVLLRMKEADDTAEPSANSITALNLLRVGYMLDQNEARKRADETLKAFAKQLEGAPSSMPQMLVALFGARSKPKQVIIAGKAGDRATEAMLREVHRHFAPHEVLILADGGAGQQFFADRVEFMKNVTETDNQPTAYVCENFVCQLPTTDMKTLASLLARGKSAGKASALRFRDE